MEVDFDGLRKRMVVAYNSLVAELNRHVDREVLGPGKPHGDTFTTGDIRDQLDNLRDLIATLISCKDESGKFDALDLNLSIFAPEEE